MRIIHLITLIALCMNTVKSAPQAIVTIQPNSMVSGASFTLGDIALITSQDAALQRKLAAVVIGVSPLPGFSRDLYHSDITSKLLMNHLMLKDLEINYPSEIHITHGGLSISSDMMVQTALSALTPLLPPNATVTPIQKPMASIVNMGQTKIVAGVPKIGDDETLATVPETIQVDGQPVRSIDIVFRIHQDIPVVVAAKTIMPHTVITSDMVALGTISSPNPDIIQDMDSIIGKRSMRLIMPGAPILCGAVEKNNVITPGAKVNLIITEGGIKITCPGIARAYGAVGDTIRVYSAETRKELSGVVIDNQNIQVEGD